MREPVLAAELVQLAEHDELVRSELLAAGVLHGGYHPKMRAVHRQNGNRLAEILDHLERWPGSDIVDVDGSRSAWLIAIHDIANPTLMRRSAALMAEAVKMGEADASDLACLVDRVRTFEGRLQLYGTQLDWNDEGHYGVWPPIENIAEVDERRLEVGLSSLADRREAIAQRTDSPDRRLSAVELADWRERENAFAVSVGWR